MADHDYTNGLENRDDDEAIQELLGLPVKNLESKIQELEKEISERQGLNEQALSTVAARRIVLEDHLHRLRYVSMFSETFIVNREFMRQLLQLEENAIREMTGCFADISELRQKLQAAREQLEQEKQRLGLMESS